MKKISEILSENFQFVEVNFSIYLNRHVSVMQQRNRIGTAKPFKIVSEN